MINWLRNWLSQEATADEVEETPDEVKENFVPVGVRVKPLVAKSLKPADTFVDGYNVDEAGIGTDDDHTMTVNDIKTTGVDPYNTGLIDVSDAEKSVPAK